MALAFKASGLMKVQTPTLTLFQEFYVLRRQKQEQLHNSNKITCGMQFSAIVHEL